MCSYRTLSGNQIIPQIQMLHADKGGIYPSLEVLDWQGPDAASCSWGLRRIPRRAGSARSGAAARRRNGAGRSQEMRCT